jgi:UDP-glucose 4-epimerase
VRALVTGGAGFIGSNLTRALVSEGARVIVLDDLSTGFRSNVSDDVDLMVGDVRDEETLVRAMRGCDVVFHLAASVGNARSIADPIRDAEINCIGTLRVLQAAHELDVAKVVYSSSAAIFGELRTLPIREDHPAEPDSPYGASKLAGEKACLAFAKLYEMDVVCLRYFNVFGENQRFDAYGNVIPIFVHRMLRTEPLTIYGDGSQTRDFVHVRDVVQANMKASHAPRVSGAYNIGSGAAVTINHLATLVAGLSQAAIEIVHTAPRPGDVRHSRADITAARNAFGYEPRVDLETGLASYIAWVEAERPLAATGVAG